MCFMAFGLMSSSASAFWGFGKSKDKGQDNRNALSAAVETKGNSEKIKITAGKQPKATLFPKNAFLPFTNFTVNPQGKMIRLDQVSISTMGITGTSTGFDVMLVVKKFNASKDRKIDNKFYEDKVIAIGTIESRTGDVFLFPSISTIAFDRSVGFSVVGVRKNSYYDDGFSGGEILSMTVVGIKATDINSGVSLNVTGLPIKGVAHTVNNSLKIGSVGWGHLFDLSNDGFLQIYTPAVSSEKTILKNLYLSVGQEWEAKDTIATVKNTSNGSVSEYPCSGVYNSMVKCLFGKGILMEKGSLLNITVNQKGGITKFPDWFDVIVYGQASGYGIVPDSGKACFLAGTKVDMADGTKKNIEDIKIGDYVKSLDTETNKVNNAKVIGVIHKIDPSHLTINNLIKTVPDQKVYTKDGFKQAQNLKLDDYLLSNKNEWIKISSISGIIYENVETYDLVLDGGNTFYADGYVAHSVEK